MSLGKGNKGHGNRCYSLFSSHKSYIYDWLVIVLIFIAGIAMDTHVPPVEREILRSESSIQYSFKHEERVQSMWIFIIGPLPAIVIVIVLLLLKRPLHQIHVTLIAFFLAHGCAMVLCTTLKLHVGRLRPDFIERCIPSINGTNPGIYGACTGKKKDIIDGRKSFPSGHASQISVAMYFLSFFLLGNLPSTKSKGGRTVKFILLLIPPYIGCFISTTRMADNRHHWEDVVVGTLIAIAVAHICYRLYYPCPFSSPFSYIPTIPLTLEQHRSLLLEKNRYYVIHPTHTNAPSSEKCSNPDPVDDICKSNAGAFIV